jgi:hypothetical protein
MMVLVVVRLGPDRARRAWLSAMAAHERAVETHRVAAALHARFGFSERGVLETERELAERGKHAEALALRPEWAGEVPGLPATGVDKRSV